MRETPDSNEANKRLGPLLHQLRPASGPCPFVVDDEAARIVALSHYSGGRDASYVLVSRKWDGKTLLPDLAVTIRYAPYVEGTTIIYDLYDETMQGKARPFVCNLGQQLMRVYAVLPFQIEQIDLKIEVAADGKRLRIAFLDARGEIVRAALPFALRISEPAGEQPEKCLATDRQGRFYKPFLEVQETSATQILVRSLLTDCGQSIDSR